MSDQLIPCPVCGESLDPETTGSCPECGALLPETALLRVREQMDDIAREDEEADRPEPPALSDEQTDELLAAFRDQFERNEINLPKVWAERLRRLAVETEAGRRQATIFFVDLRGYTRLSQVLTDIQLDRLRQWFYEICTRHVELHGGFIIQFLGDAVYAAFGAPWAFERDAESALQALIDIRDDVRRKGTYEGHELAIRAGADTGIVNVRLTEEHGRPRPDLFGSPVNLAARLEAQSDTWEILVSDTLADQVRGVFEMEEKPAWTPKNYGREVVPYAVLGHKGEQAIRRREDLEFVGRADELTRLAGWMERARAGEFAAVRLEGEAGVGKTRLVKEMIRRAGDPPLNSAFVDCEPHDRHVLLGPMIKLLRAFARWGGGVNGPAQLPHETVFAVLAGRLAQVEPYVLPSIGYILGVQPHFSTLRSMPARELRAQVVASLISLIEAVCRIAPPWIIFLDDLQWSDPLTREVVEGVIGRRPPGLLLVVAGRPETEGGDLNPMHEPAPELDWEMLEVGALKREDRLALLAQILDVDRLHPIVRRQLLEESEGIPIYMIEMAQELGEKPGGEFEAALASLESQGDKAGMTSLVMDLLQARIDKLSRQRRALLQCAAILGRRFDLKAIKLFEQMHSELLSELYALKGLRMLREEPLPDDMAFYFSPTLLREAAYRMLSPEQKAGLHRTVARQIEKRFARNLKSFSYELAVHWLRAGEPVRARPYLRRAAQRALDEGVPQEAYDLSAMALDGMRPPGPVRDDDSEAILSLQQRGVMEEVAGKAARWIGDYNRADEHFRNLGQIAGLIANGQWLANSRFQMAVTAKERGNMDEAERLAAAVHGEGPGMEDLSARARNLTGVIMLRTGRVKDALGVFDSLARAIEGKERLQLVAADAWNNAGLVQWHLGDLAAARVSFSRSLDIWHRVGNLYGQVQTLSNMGIAAEKQGRLDEASELYARASEIAERIGYILGLSAIEANRANLSLLRQEWFNAQEQSARALHAARLIGHRNSEAIGLENLGLALGGLGQLDEALATLEQASTLGLRMGDPERRDSARLAGASVALHNNQHNLARRFMAMLPEELPADLNTWRETIDRTLDILNGAQAKAAEFAASLDEIQKTATLEDYLRRLDAVVLLCDTGRLAAPREEFELRRKAALSVKI